MAAETREPGPGERYCTACRAVVAEDAASCPACGAAQGGDVDAAGGLDLPFGWIVGVAGGLSALTFLGAVPYYAADVSSFGVAVVAAMILTGVLSLVWIKLAFVGALLVGSLRREG